MDVQVTYFPYVSWEMMPSQEIVPASQRPSIVFLSWFSPLNKYLNFSAYCKNLYRVVFGDHRQT